MFINLVFLELAPHFFYTMTVKPHTFFCLLYNCKICPLFGRHLWYVMYSMAHKCCSYDVLFQYAFHNYQKMIEKNDWLAYSSIKKLWIHPCNFITKRENYIILDYMFCTVVLLVVYFRNMKLVIPKNWSWQDSNPGQQGNVTCSYCQGIILISYYFSWVYRWSLTTQDKQLSTQYRSNGSFEFNRLKATSDFFSGANSDVGICS
jgi:hypothetical protein